jgi:hypothetical protein
VRQESGRRRVRVERAGAHVLGMQLANVLPRLARAPEAGCARVDSHDVPVAPVRAEGRARIRALSEP